MHKKTETEVLHIFGVLNRGGAEMRTIALQEVMIEHNIRYDYLVLTGNVGVLDSQVNALGSRIYYLRLNLSFAYKFYKLLKSSSYQVVHSHVGLPSAFLLSIAFLAGVNGRVAHFRSVKEIDSPSLVRKMRDTILVRIMELCATDILGVCEGALEGHFGKQWYKNRKCKVIYNGFEPVDETRDSAFWPNHIDYSMESPIIINVARMHPVKNHKRIVEIFNDFRISEKKGTLVLVGKEDDDIRGAIDGFAREQNIDVHIHFLGEQINPLIFLANADVMLFPSFWEGLPGAVLESLSVGTPVVSTTLPGTEEISRHLHGIKSLDLCEKNSVWVDTIVETISNGRANNKSKFNQTVFSMDICKNETLSIYSKYE